MFSLLFLWQHNCTEVIAFWNCTQDKCGKLWNTVCNPESGACECDEDRVYLLQTGKCKKAKGLYVTVKL